MNTWSLDLQKETERILYNMPADVFGLAEAVGRKGVSMKNHDGQWGYITLQSCFSDKYPIQDHETDAVIADFKTIQELLDADWAVD